MTPKSHVVLLAVWAVSATAAAAESMLPSAASVMMPGGQAARFVRMEDFDFAALLPPPPAPGSIAAAADLETVLQVQAARTEVQVAWAKRMEKDDVFLNREILGDWFVPERLPKTAAFFQALGNDLKAVDAAAKQPFRRKRPYDVDPRVEPCVSRPASWSYPSGSALQALVWAELLAEQFPARREALVARAHRAGWGRVIGGVHFPSDIVAGQRLAPAFLQACKRNPAFVAAFDAAKTEMAAASGASGR